jgi:CBS-domain-containing membrane protein
MTATVTPARVAGKGVAMKLDNVAAADVMAPNPISIAARANVQEALMLLIDKNFSAAPVIDDSGRPVGVISRSDLLVHDREVGRRVIGGDYYSEPLLPGRGSRLPDGFQEENVDPTTVEDIMTPAVFTVRQDTPVCKVVEEMLGLHVHRMFVTDGDGTLIGVISTMDVLKNLQPMR